MELIDMDNVKLAGQIVPLLATYLMEAGKSVGSRFADDVSGQLRSTASQMFSCVKEKFATDHQAANDLSGLEQKPQSKPRQDIVQELLSEFMADDQNFAQKLRELSKAAGLSSQDTITVTMNVSESTVGEITQIGKIVNRD